jgi:hypothetical protein
VKKKLWIRVVGVLALLAWAFVYLLFRTTSHMPVGVDAGYGVIFAIFCAGLAGLITAVWALFSVIDWSLRRSAKLQAAKPASPFGPGIPARGPWTPAPAPAAAPAPEVAVCAHCRRYLAEFVCNAHNWPLCSQCAGPHTRDAEGCTLRGLQAMATAPSPRPRAVNTSPLAGMR